MGQPTMYEEVPGHLVPIEKRFDAMTTKDFCKEDMALPAIEIVWAQKCSPRHRQYSGRIFKNNTEVLGCALTDKNIIMINVETPEDKVPFITAHECRHFYQSILLSKPPGTCDFEKDANTYAYQALTAQDLHKKGNSMALTYTNKKLIWLEK